MGPALAFGDDLREMVAARLDRHRVETLALDDRRAAAVAVVLIPDVEGEVAFFLTRRGSRLRGHTGQWALPGGRLDPGESPEVAARRELHEELGLDLPESSVLGRLDDYPTRSGYLITPVVVWGGEVDDEDIFPNPDEVAACYRIAFREVCGRDGVRFATIPESDRPVIQVPIQGQLVHAPTAAVIHQASEVVVHGRDTRVAHYEQPVFAWA